MQLAEQSIEDFMARRGFHVTPEHEDTWVVPVSLVPATYNLHARMQAAADTTTEDVGVEPPVDNPDAEAPSPRGKQPCKPKLQVCLHALQ